MKYPKAKKHTYLEVPALTLSGGTLKEFGNNPLEYRVWLHGEEDYYETFDTYEKAKKFAKKKHNAHAESPLAVVWDSKYNGFREVAVE